MIENFNSTKLNTISPYNLKLKLIHGSFVLFFQIRRRLLLRSYTINIFFDRKSSNVSQIGNKVLFLHYNYNIVSMTTFQLALLEEAKIFLEKISPQARKKILYNIWRVAGGERNSELFKKLENSEVWEFRTLYNGIAYRLFAFWDTEGQTLVVATHGIIKKTQKTPKKEIMRAEGIMKQYFELKDK